MKRHVLSLATTVSALFLAICMTVIDTALSAEEDLIGIRVGRMFPRSNTARPPSGVAVNHVVPGRPAEKAGVKPGDLITKVGNVTVSDVEHYRIAIASLAIGEPVQFRISRLDANKRWKTLSVKITPVELPRMNERAAQLPNRDAYLEFLAKKKIEDATRPAVMHVVIGGHGGQLPAANVFEVRKDDEVVLEFFAPDLVGTRFVLLKGVRPIENALIADGFALVSDRTWRVTGKETYKTTSGTERSIFVAQPVDSSQTGGEGCMRGGRGRPKAYAMPETSRIVQILNKEEMLVVVSEVAVLKHSWKGQLEGGAAMILLRGLDTTQLTEDSVVPKGPYDITGTYSYTSKEGGRRTVLVAEP
jgi:hypothetical protein